MNFAGLGLLVLIAACIPPETDEVAGDNAVEALGDRPSTPLPSPDTEGAIWATGGKNDTLVYGIPGQPPLLALICHPRKQLDIVRYARADRGAKALMAVLGNKGNARLPVDAVANGRTSLWRGRFSLDRRELDVLSSTGTIEVMVPGAGSLILDGSDSPGEFLIACRAPA
ncbi:MAG: hypothetical protein WA948_10775 [Pontixanthobacter sp.]